MSRITSPCMEGDFPSPVHFWEEERKQAESERRITGFLSCCLLASSNAKHAAPSSALLEELPAQLAAAAPMFVEFVEARSHDTFVV